MIFDIFFPYDVFFFQLFEVRCSNVVKYFEYLWSGVGLVFKAVFIEVFRL